MFPVVFLASSPGSPPRMYVDALTFAYVCYGAKVNASTYVRGGEPGAKGMVFPQFLCPPSIFILYAYHLKNDDAVINTQMRRYLRDIMQDRGALL